MRIDKFIWCVRLTKTRSLATSLCQDEKVRLNNAYIKASKEVKVNDIIQFKENPIWRSFIVLELPKSRLGAALTPKYINEITETNDLEQLSIFQSAQRTNKVLGIKGRPTKKDRRDLDKLL
jgi:ribosome-associated heat shock protein Hsp15